MNSPAHDIINFLESTAGGSHGTIGVTLFAHYEPDSPDACITVIDTGGSDGDTHGFKQPTVQVRVRGARGGFTSAYATMNSLITSLHASYGWSEGGATYTGVWQQGDVLALGLDAKDRPTFTANFRLHRRA